MIRLSIFLLFLSLKGLQGNSSAEDEMRLKLGFERPGYAVYVFNSEPDQEVPFGHGEYDKYWRLRLVYRPPSSKSDTKPKVLKDLNDLRGAVYINDAQTALRYVRLLTAPATRKYWWQRPALKEITVTSDIKNIPTFGWKFTETMKFRCTDSTNPNIARYCIYDPLTNIGQFKEWNNRTKEMKDIKKVANPELSLYGNFELACLPKKVFYQENHFSAARAEKTSNGFKITRWIGYPVYSDDYMNGEFPRYFAEHVQETVGKDGSYKRKVLKKRQWE